MTGVSGNPRAFMPGVRCIIHQLRRHNSRVPLVVAASDESYAHVTTDLSSRGLLGACGLEHMTRVRKASGDDAKRSRFFIRKTGHGDGNSEQAQHVLLILITLSFEAMGICRCPGSVKSTT